MKNFIILILICAAGTASPQGLKFYENKGQLESPAPFYTELSGSTAIFSPNSVTYTLYRDDKSTAEYVGHHKFDSVYQKEHQSYTVSFQGGAYSKIQPTYKQAGLYNFYQGNNPAKWATGVRSFGGLYYPSLYHGIDMHVYSQEMWLKYDFIVSPNASPSQISLLFSDADSISISPTGDLLVHAGWAHTKEYAPFAYQKRSCGATDTISCAFVINGKSVSFALGSYNRSDTLFIDPFVIFSTYTGSMADNWGSSATYDEDGNAYTSGVVGIGGIYPAEGGNVQFIHGGGHGSSRWDIGLMKISADGRDIIYATYFGGNGTDSPHSMIVNSRNELILFGTTGSDDMPKAINRFTGGDAFGVGGFLDFNNGCDMFVAKFNHRGELLTSAYVGGSSNDGINYYPDVVGNAVYQGNGALYYNYGDWARGEVVTDSDDNIYIGAMTYSADLPRARNAHSGGMDGVVARLSPNLLLEWTYYLGGSAHDAVFSLEMDRRGHEALYVAGGTLSSDMPVQSTAYNPAYRGGTDGFVFKLSLQGNILAGTYFGSPHYDQAYFVRRDKQGFVYIFGQTAAEGSMLIHNAAYNNPGSGQFVAKLNNDLTELVWSTVFGTGDRRPNISPTAFSVDLCQRVYLSGSGREWSRFPERVSYYPPMNMYRADITGTKGLDVTAGAYMSDTDGMDFYIMVMLDDASALDYASFLGELKSGDIYFTLSGYYWNGNDPCGDDHVDGGTSRFDREGNVYQAVCASCGGCQGYPVEPADAVSATNNSSNCNNAVTKFNIHSDFVVAKFKAFNNPCEQHEIVFENNSVAAGNLAVEYEWDFGDGSPASLEFSPTHKYLSAGEYQVMLIAKDMSACNLRDTLYKTITVTDTPGLSLPPFSICHGDTIRLGFADFDDPSFAYTWQPALYLDDGSRPDPTAIMLSSVKYKLTAESSYCKLDFEQDATVLGGNLQTEIIVENMPPGASQICSGALVRLAAASSSEVAAYEWSWDPNFSSLINASPTDSTVSLRPEQNMTVYLRSTGRYCGGLDTASVLLQIAAADIMLQASASKVCTGQHLTIEASELNSKPLTYRWSPESAIAAGQGTAAVTVFPVGKQSISLLATDANGCLFPSSLTVEAYLPSLSASAASNITCFGLNNGNIELSASGQAPYVYTWADIGSASPQRSSLPPGGYSATVTDALGCQADTAIKIISPPRLTMLATAKDETCLGICNGQIVVSYGGGTPPVSVIVNNMHVADTAASLCQGIYDIAVTDINGCGLSQSLRIGLTESLPAIKASAAPASIFKGEKVQLSATPSGLPEAGVTYAWRPPMDIAEIQGAQAVARPGSTTLFSVTAVDMHGCADTDTVLVSVKDFICDFPFIYVPNSFSPNGDGINDVFQVKSDILDEFTIIVFSRWGQMVWQASSAAQYWDGSYNGELLSPAVFDYYLEGRCFDGQKVKMKGNINLIR
jgi:gliding motility-associated-like protein